MNGEKTYNNNELKVFGITFDCQINIIEWNIKIEAITA